MSYSVHRYNSHRPRGHWDETEFKQFQQKHYYDRDPDAQLGYAFGHLGVALLAGALSWSFEKIMSSQAKALLEARRANRSVMLVHRLLSSMCDCIVKLDSDLCIAEPCPKLAGLLFCSSGSTLVAKPFVSYVPMNEQERFNCHVAKETMIQGEENDDPASFALPLQIDLLDSNGMLVHVSMFHSFIRDVDGQEFHLIGIKEAAETQWRGHESMCATNVPIVVERCGPIDELSCSHSSGLPSASSIVDGNVCEELGVPDGAAVVWIDPANLHQLDIVGCNAVFRTLGGAMPIGRPLCEWIVDRHREMLVAKLSEHLNTGLLTIGTTRAETKLHRRLGNIRFEPPGMVLGGSRLEFTADCTVTCDIYNLVHNDDDDGDDGRFFRCVQLTLEHIKQCYTRAGRPELENRRDRRAGRKRAVERRSQTLVSL